MKILFVVPPGFSEVLAHHEATSGMGALDATAAGTGEAGFLYPPHTVAACAAAARAANAEIAVLDGARRPAPADFAAEVTAQSGDVLAVLVSQGTAYADETFLYLLRRLRPAAGGTPILLFGPSAHLVAEPWLAEGLADAALLGEPEGAFAEAAAQLAAGALSGLVPAATLRPDRYLTVEVARSETGHSTDGPGVRLASPLLRGEGPGVRSLLADLDALPFPAWDLAPWQPYGVVSLLSSRGCPAGCAYCAYTVAQGTYVRAQSPERTVAELAWLAETIQPPRLQVRDPVFAHDRARVAAICQGLIAGGIRVSFNCESRPEHFDDDLLRLLRAAGCRRIKVGLESGDPALLQRLGRAADAAAAEAALSQALRVARTCAAIGLRCQVFVMAGLPGQDAASLARTEAVLRQLPAGTMITAKPYRAHPGTPLDAATAPVPAETLARLERGNVPKPSLARRIWQRIETEKRIIEGKRRSGAAPPLPQSPIPSPQSLVPDSRVFLTGGNGFLGGHVARALCAAGVQVVAMVRPGSDLGPLAELPAEIVRGDLARPSEWRAALAGCGLCFHVAALYGGADQAQAMYGVNVAATGALLAACAEAGVRRVVYTGTIGTVGRPAGHGARSLPDETTPFNLWDQASHYVRSKYLGEQVARAWNGAGLDVVIVKPTAPVGAGDARPSATGRRIVAALRGEVTAYPAGGVNHAPVIDVAAGHLLAAARGAAGRTYILGHGAGNLDHAAFLRRMAEAAGTRPLRAPQVRGGHAVGLPAALTADPARAVRELGLPQSDLQAAFAAAVAWYRATLDIV